MRFSKSLLCIAYFLCKNILYWKCNRQYRAFTANHQGARLLEPYLIIMHKAKINQNVGLRGSLAFILYHTVRWSHVCTVWVRFMHKHYSQFVTCTNVSLLLQYLSSISIRWFHIIILSWTWRLREFSRVAISYRYLHITYSSLTIANYCT